MVGLFTCLSIYFSGVYVFCLKREHLLVVLLSLEYIVLFLLMLIVVFDYDYFFPVIFVFSVCEGTLGLSILVLMVMIFNYFLIPICLLNNG